MHASRKGGGGVGVVIELDFFCILPLSTSSYDWNGVVCLIFTDEIDRWCSKINST